MNMTKNSLKLEEKICIEYTEKVVEDLKKRIKSIEEDIEKMKYEVKILEESL